MPAIISVSCLSLITLTYFICIEDIANSAYIGLLFVNTVISGWAMLGKPMKPFTLQKMVNLFIYVFFIVANAVQFARNTRTLTFNISFTDDDYVIFQMLVCGILIIFNGVYNFIYKQKTVKLLPKSDVMKVSNSAVNAKLLIILACVAAAIIILQYRSNLMRLFFRGIEHDTLYHVSELNSETSSNLVIDKFVRPLPFVALLISLIGNCKSSIKWLLLGITLIVTCPTGISRNAAAMVWLPIFIMVYGMRLKNNIFIWVMLAALFVVFPFFNIFRSWNGSVSFTWSMDFLNDINFDASQILMAVIKTDFVSNGYQLLGVLFFFVPRSLWTTKPVGSGSALVDSMHGYFNNVSMPYFGEGYVNFGFCGILAFTVFLSWLCAKLDISYWTGWCKTRNFNQGYYLIAIGMIVFVMRGDLMSSFAYTIGVMGAYSFCLLLTTNYHFTRLRFK